MSKCNWEYAGRCCHYKTFKCTLGNESGQCVFRVTLPEPVKVPNCPRCNTPMKYCQRASGPFEMNWSCVSDNPDCDWTQPDSDQRPKMPEPREGYHAGEYRALKGGDYWFADGRIIGPASPLPHTLKRWIAVKDEVKPAVEPVVRYWKYSDKHFTIFAKTVDGVVVESTDELFASIGSSMDNSNYKPCATSAYEAAKQPNPVVEPLSFEQELRSLINKYSYENKADMPDFIMADMVCRFLESIGPAVKQTLDWHGRDSACHPKQVNRLEGAKG